MWVSWRAKTERGTGGEQGRPVVDCAEIVLPPTGIAWADDINRPTVLKRADAADRQRSCVEAGRRAA